MYVSASAVDTVYIKGSGSSNEDAYLADGERGFFAVIDGATALSDDRRSAGDIAAKIVRDSLAAWDGKGTLQDAVKCANEDLARKSADIYAESSGHAKADRSSCVLSAVLLEGTPDGIGMLSYAHVGDCMLFTLSDDGSVQTLTCDQTFHLDAQAIRFIADEWKHLLADGMSPDSLSRDEIGSLLRNIRQRATPLLRANREKMNTPDGYGALDGSSDAVKYLESGRVGMEHISKILLLSDGLFLTDRKGTDGAGWIDTARYAFNHGLDALAQRVLDLEKSDPACCRYPRLKPSDDKTGILISI